MDRKRSWPAVSHICNRTTVEVSISTTLFVKKEAPTVDCVVGGVKAFLTYRWTREVFPTPWLPRTTIFASRLLDISPYYAKSICIRRCWRCRDGAAGGVVGSAQICAVAVPRSKKERKCVGGGGRTSCMASSEKESPADVRRGRGLT